MDDDRRREASLVTLAMSGSAIAGTCTVTWCRDSRVRRGREGEGTEMGKGSTDTKNLRRRSYL